MSSRHSSSDGASDDATDPSAIILPHIETDEDILLGYDLSELVLFIPPTLFGLVGVTTFLGGNLFLAGIFAFPAVIGGLLAMYFAFTSTWYAPPRERLRDAVKYLRSRWETPLGHDEAVGAVHGVRSIDEDGTAKC